VCLTTAVVTVRVGEDPIAAPERELPFPVTALAIVALMALVAAVWLLRPNRPGAALGLSIATIATLLPLWAAWSWLGPAVRAATLAVLPVATVGVALVAAGWAGARPVAGARLFPAGALLAGAAALVHLTGYDPFADPGCARTCERVRPLAEGLLTVRTAVAMTCSLTIAAAVVAAIALRRAFDPRPPTLVLGALFVVLGGLATGAAVRWATWGGGAAWSVVWLLMPAAVALIAAAVCVVEARSWRTRRALDRIVARLSAPSGGLETLSGGLRDVHFAVPGSARWVDADGNDIGAVDEATKYVVLHQNASPVLRLVLARGADEGDVVAALTPASRLSLRNAQLSAVALAHLADVRASQRRVITTADAERRRIERDLHDGAQQRLIGVCFQLGIARTRVDAATAPTLHAAERRVRRALARLRELAHGMFPRVLADEGLEAALEELVSASPTAATLDLELDGPLDPEVAMAAYATVLGTLSHARGEPDRPSVRISVAKIDDDLVVRIELLAERGAGPDFTEVADRVGAIGGTLTVSSASGGGVSVSAVIPCGS
jgi:signal transduction histidine kinase